MLLSRPYRQSLPPTGPLVWYGRNGLRVRDAVLVNQSVRLRCQNVMVAATSQQLRQKSNSTSREGQVTVGAAILTALFATVSKQEDRG